MRGGKYGRGAKSLSLAEALGNKGRNKGNPPAAEILQPEESTTSRREQSLRLEAPAAHGEEDLRLELGEALEKLSRIQADYYAGLASVGDFNDAKCRVGDLRNQLDVVNPGGPDPVEIPDRDRRPQWIRQIPQED